MSIESMEIYSCSICGCTLTGMEWEEHTGEKEYKCPSCRNDLNEDELHSED